MYDLETDMSILSDNLIYYRKLAGKTVMDVERATGISHSTYTCWEQGYPETGGSGKSGGSVRDHHGSSSV